MVDLMVEDLNQGSSQLAENTIRDQNRRVGEEGTCPQLKSHAPHSSLNARPSTVESERPDNFFLTSPPKQIVCRISSLLKQNI